MKLLSLLVLIAPLFEISKLVGDRRARTLELIILKQARAMLLLLRPLLRIAFYLVGAFLFWVFLIFLSFMLELSPLWPEVEWLIKLQSVQLLSIIYPLIELGILLSFLKTRGQLELRTFLVQWMVLAWSYSLTIRIFNFRTRIGYETLVFLPLAIMLLKTQMDFVSHLGILFTNWLYESKMPRALRPWPFRGAPRQKVSGWNGFVIFVTIPIIGTVYGIIGFMSLLVLGFTAKSVIFLEKIRHHLGTPLFVNIVIYSLTAVGVVIVIYGQLTR